MYVAAPPAFPLVTSDFERFRQVQEAIKEAGLDEDPGYVHWDKLRHLAPPGDITHAEWWDAITWARSPNLRRLPLTDGAGDPFAYSTPDSVLELLHFVDQRCAGEIAMDEVVTADDQARAHYLVNSLMEEAIRS